MAWLAANPLATVEARVPDEDGGLVFEIGYVPPSILDRIYVTRDAALSRSRTDDSPVTLETLPNDLATLDSIREFMWLAVKWGCRGWKAVDGEPAPILRNETVGGRSYPALADETLDVLAATRVATLRGPTTFLALVALKVLDFNAMTEAQKKTWRSPSRSNSSRTGTSASSATPPADSRPTSAPAITSATTEFPLTGARGG